MRRWAPPLLVAIACLSAGCSRQDAAWRQAESAGTETAYAAYLAAYPDGLHAADAERRLAELRHDREWSRAERLGTPESYQRYLARHPGGRHAGAARERLSLFLAPPSAPRADALAPPEGASPDAPPSVEVAGAEERWLQLGAFVGGEAVAEAAWQRLAAAHPDQLGGLGHRIVRAGLPSGDLWRLFAGPVAPGEGATRCAALGARGTSCLLRDGRQVVQHVTK